MRNLWLFFLCIGLLTDVNFVSAETTASTSSNEQPSSGPLLNEPEVNQSTPFDNGVLSNRVKAMRKVADNPFALIPYDANYFIYTYSTDMNRELYADAGFDGADDLVDHEAKFQLSLVFPIWRNILGEGSVLGASYTQLSLWQATNSDISAPFRETNYEPQVFINFAQDLELFGFTLKGIDIGFNHQSNGRGEALSRSWNRIFANFAFQRGNLGLVLNPYIRLQEKEEEDDNPNIEDYLGNFKLGVAYRYGDAVFSSTSRYSFSGNKGSLLAGISYPLTRNTRIYFQLFSGYGETLIDYDFNQTRIGFGIMLNDVI